MNETARDRILDRLRRAPRAVLPRPSAEGVQPSQDQSAAVARLKSLMEAVRTEVHLVSASHWLPKLKDALRARPIKTLLYAPGTDIGVDLHSDWDADNSGLPELVPYTEPVESFKERLFSVDAAITGAVCAVADTGAIILRPTAREPRLMSLAPPVHIAVLQSDAVFPSLSEAMRKGRWSADMPTNMLLISGPSKTADIELTLAFGVHGPKELIVFILDQ
jgi:L-lactate dehydrogenase complex protein LldG